MNRLIMAIASVVTAASAVAAADDMDYTKGVFIVNEDWYGHQNSTVNYLMPDNDDGDFWHYRVIQAENPGMELGCTNQFGAIWNGRFYLIAKQDKDPGAYITGGRITVADAVTLKVIKQLQTIDPSGAQCDGRGFVGVDNNKGYVSSSNGIWILDLNTLQITGQVEGTANPNIDGGNDKPNTNPTGSLYHGQCGTMVRAAGRIFAAHQSAGLLVIDPETDRVTNVISMDFIASGAGIGSIVQSKDGNLWISVAKDCQGTGTPLPYIVNINPSTLAVNTVEIKSPMLPPANSWYAWTPDAFCASSVTNSLYWKGSTARWFAGTKIYKMDIDTGTVTELINLDTEGANWKIYGCSLGIHPTTDELYVSLYHEFGTPTYITRRYSADGTKIQDYAMIENYWFPSLPVFPQDSRTSSGIDAVTDHAINVSACYSNGMLTLLNAAGCRLDIFSMTGTLVYSSPVTDSTQQFSPGLQPGIYIVRAGHFSTRMVINN